MTRLAAATPVPALDPATRYASRLSARSALYTELQMLLDAAGDQDLAPLEHRSLVIDAALQRVQEGRVEGAEGGPRDFRILTPWKGPKERPKGWDPDLDDGVKVNIEPLVKAGVLRLAKVS